MSSRNSRFRKSRTKNVGSARTRHQMIQANRDLTMEHLNKARQKGIREPVVFFIDVSSPMGKAIFGQIANAHPEWVPDHDKFVERCVDEQAIPTMHMCFSWDQAVELLAATSPTARQSMRDNKRSMGAIREKGLGCGLVVSIGLGGNSYALITWPEGEQKLPLVFAHQRVEVFH